MKFVEELVVEEFLPTLRSMLAEELSDRGKTQREIAAYLGISQSAVSKYVHGDVTVNERVRTDDHVRQLVDRLADGLTDGEMTPVEALVEAEVAIRDLEVGGVLAEMHAEAVPELGAMDVNFAVHDPDSRLREASQVRASLRRGLRILQNTDGFAGQIPAVGSNLVECLEGAETIEDVAAVPGRILEVRGQVEVPGEPEFGVSQHVAGVLLAARRQGHEARATLNVAHDEAVLEALADAGHVTVEFDAETSIEAAIASALETTPEATVLYQSGGFGIEPVTYLLGPDAPSVAAAVRDVR